MLLGKYIHTIDAKNRCFIPVKMRRDFCERCILTKDFEYKCLNIFSVEEFEKYKQQIDSLPYYENRIYKEEVFGNADECDIDAQGRIVINQLIFGELELKKEVLIIGVSTHIKIWNPAFYEKRNEPEMQNESFKKLSDAVKNLKF